MVITPSRLGTRWCEDGCQSCLQVVFSRSPFVPENEYRYDMFFLDLPILLFCAAVSATLFAERVS